MKTRMIVLLLLAAGTTAMARSAAELIKKLDKDGDGKISESEFDGPAEQFSKFDKNSDGYLSKDEIPSTPPPRGGRGGRDD